MTTTGIPPPIGWSTVWRTLSLVQSGATATEARASAGRISGRGASTSTPGIRYVSAASRGDSWLLITRRTSGYCDRTAGITWRMNSSASWLSDAPPSAVARTTVGGPPRRGRERKFSTSTPSATTVTGPVGLKPWTSFAASGGATRQWAARRAARASVARRRTPSVWKKREPGNDPREACRIHHSESRWAKSTITGIAGSISIAYWIMLDDVTKTRS